MNVSIKIIVRQGIRRELTVPGCPVASSQNIVVRSYASVYYYYYYGKAGA